MEGHNDQQNWLAAIITGMAGFLSHVVPYIIRKGKKSDLENVADDTENRLYHLERDSQRFREDFLDFKLEMEKWQATTDRRLSRIARGLIDNASAGGSD